ncbi:MAG: hypothetical protein D6725_07830 [Planctomycetota bacterium]|nr:MAG: hypothetical protein D6725_07830 [Planctomycetota bacterium]
MKSIVIICRWLGARVCDALSLRRMAWAPVPVRNSVSRAWRRDLRLWGALAVGGVATVSMAATPAQSGPNGGGQPAAAETRPAAGAEKNEKSTVVYAAMAPDVVRLRVINWVATYHPKDARLAEKIGKLWAFAGETPSGTRLLELAAESFALADPEVADVFDALRPPREVVLLPNIDRVLARYEADTFFAANFRLYCSRLMTQQRMYDEALDLLTPVELVDVIDPATFFFCKTVAHHALMHKEEGLKAVGRLLHDTEDVPERYRALAVLMEYDLKSLKEGSLDAAARLMNDVERRLALGRGGARVQKKEDEIIEILDEIIKKIEQQQAGGGGGGGSGSNSNQSSSPAADSSVKGSTAPGEVDPKDLGKKAGWGNLPPKAQAKAKNLINRHFPAHYREAIEEYFRKLAGRRRTVEPK